MKLLKWNRWSAIALLVFGVSVVLFAFGLQI